MKDLYVEISERLSSKVPQLRLIDLDYGQIDAQGRRSVMGFPLALVLISLTRCEDKSRTEQDRHVQIAIRLAWEAWPEETSSVTPDRWKFKALENMNLIDRVIDSLHGWGGSFFDYLSLINVTPERRADGLAVYRLTFEMSFEVNYEE